MGIYGWIHISHTSTYDLDQGACYAYDLIDRSCWKSCTHILHIVIYLWHTWLLAQTALIEEGRFVSSCHPFQQKSESVVYLLTCQKTEFYELCYVLSTMPELKIMKMINRTAPTSHLPIYSFMILPCHPTTVSRIRMFPKCCFIGVSLHFLKCIKSGCI